MLVDVVCMEKFSILKKVHKVFVNIIELMLNLKQIEWNEIGSQV